MVTGKGYGRWLRDAFVVFISLSFSSWGMVAGDGYGKSLGDGYGRWLREVFVFLFFLIFLLTGDGYGKSLFSCLSLSFSLWGMVAGDGYGKSLGDGCGRWLWEVFVFLFFS